MRERGLKFLSGLINVNHLNVAPVRERGLKYQWNHHEQQTAKVAPVRERGLKSAGALKFSP